MKIESGAISSSPTQLIAEAPRVHSIGTPFSAGTWGATIANLVIWTSVSRILLNHRCAISVTKFLICVRAVRFSVQLLRSFDDVFDASLPAGKEAEQNELSMQNGF